MKNNKKSAKSGKFFNRGKQSLLIAAIALILAATVGATIAFITVTPDALTNTFTPSKLTSEIVEDVSGGLKKSVKIKNTGDVDAYIRVAVIGNQLNDNGEIVGPFNVGACLAGTDWVKYGDYYYWTEKVAPGASTGELLKTQIDLKGIQVNILSDAIQADPAKAVGEAWGVVIAENSVTPYSAG